MIVQSGKNSEEQLDTISQLYESFPLRRTCIAVIEAKIRTTLSKCSASLNGMLGKKFSMLRADNDDLQSIDEWVVAADIDECCDSVGDSWPRVDFCVVASRFGWQE